jgi:hypothetical protein
MELLILKGYTKHFPYTNLEFLITQIWNLNLKPKLNEFNLNIEILKALFLNFLVFIKGWNCLFTNLILKNSMFKIDLSTPKVI